MGAILAVFVGLIGFFTFVLVEAFANLSSFG